MKQSIAILTILLFQSAFAAAQSASFLEIIPDARTAGTGAAGVSSAQGAFSIYHNTAALSFGEQKAGAAYSYSPWMNAYNKGYALHSVAAYYRISPKIGTVTIGYRYFKMPTYDIVGDNGENRGNFKPDDMSFDIGYAYAINENVGIAANFRYIRSSIEDGDTGSAFAGDLSAYYQANRFRAGLSLMNVGSKISYDDLKHSMPAKAKLGAAYTYELAATHLLTGNAEVAYKFLPSDYTGFEAGIGAEYTYNNLLSARVGYHLGDKNKTSQNYGTVGVGIQIYGVHVDAAYLIAQSDSPLKDCFWLSLGVNF